MNQGRILLHDWETTGLTLHPNADPRKQPRAIEFGGILLAVDGDAATVEEEVSLIINPEQQIEEIITKITGLTQAQLDTEPPFAAMLPQIEPVYAKADGIVSHNLPFDKQIMIGELARLGRTDFPWPTKELCTVNFFTDHWGRFPKMTEVYEWTFERPLAQTHRALDDVKALAEIFIHHKLWRYM